jgi:hypothetical protein
MRFPVDTSRLKRLVVAAAEELRQSEEGKPRPASAPRNDASRQVPWLRLGQCVAGEVQHGRIACGA